MKTLIFNGSPRKSGNSSFLSQKLIENLSGDIKLISAYYDNIKPCIDCRYCYKKPGCSINDDMTQIYEDVITCDNVIISSPVYFSQPTGELLNIFSRFQTFFCAKFIREKEVELKKKKGVVIITAGGKGSPIPAIETAKKLLKYLNAECFAEITSLNTDKLPANQDLYAIKLATEVSKKLNAK